MPSRTEQTGWWECILSDPLGLLVSLLLTVPFLAGSPPVAFNTSRLPLRRKGSKQLWSAGASVCKSWKPFMQMLSGNRVFENLFAEGLRINLVFLVLDSSCGSCWLILRCILCPMLSSLSDRLHTQCFQNSVAERKKNRAVIYYVLIKLIKIVPLLLASTCLYLPVCLSV